MRKETYVEISLFYDGGVPVTGSSNFDETRKVRVQTNFIKLIQRKTKWEVNTWHFVSEQLTKLPFF